MSIFGRVRGRLSGVQADQDPHSWHFPNKYSISSSTSRATVIPNPVDLRNAFVPDATTHAPHKTALIYPDSSHAAVHLCLLECFRNLRTKAIKLDIQSYKPPAYAQDASPDESFAEESLPESLHWDLLVQLAVTRFTTWWKNLPQVFDHAIAYGQRGGAIRDEIQLPVNYLPPLDVLLVWYSLILDEQEYSRVSHQACDTRLSMLCFPWPAIRDAIDRDTMTFELPRPAEILFSTISEQAPDILTYLDAPPAYAESNESPFAIDLVLQVHQQEAFIDASHQALWIRSPTLTGSLQRAALDYVGALTSGRLGSLTQDEIPFGIHLIWRTHRLFPAQYLNHCSNAGFDTADSASDLKVIHSSETAQSSSSFRSDSSGCQICICWICESIRDNKPEWKYDSVTRSYDTEILAQTSPEQLLQIKDDVGFYRAAESNRRQGLPLPTRPLTSKEKNAEKLEARKQKELGQLPGLNEYIEVLPNGKKKYRISRAVRASYGHS